MDPIQAIVFGIVQGLTEFLPISSSAHLVILPRLLGWRDPGLTFDVALHLGTLLAVLSYFWRDWLAILAGLARTLNGPAPDPNEDSAPRARSVPDVVWRATTYPLRAQSARLFWLLAIACIPAAIIGVLLEGVAENALRNPLLIAFFTIGLGMVLVMAEVLSSRKRGLTQIGGRDAILIGLSQALAICPGVSRSGITMTTGLLRGLTREAAARFSFLMSAPIIGGAGIYSLRHLVEQGLPPDERLAFVLGFAAASVVGFLTIKYLLRYLQRNSLLVFAYYRFVFGAAVIVLVFRGIIR